MKPPLFSCLTSRVANNGSLYGRFLFGPLPIDISLTVATVLRRSLLHSQATFTIVSAEIEGATHEYASLPGIQESVLEILLNLGEIVLTSTQRNLINPNFRTSIGTSPFFFANTRVSGPGIVTAKDINWPKGIFCVKPNLVICTLSSNETLTMRLKIACSLNKNKQFVYENKKLSPIGLATSGEGLHPQRLSNAQTHLFASRHLPVPISYGHEHEPEGQEKQSEKQSKSLKKKAKSISSQENKQGFLTNNQNPFEIFKSQEFFQTSTTTSVNTPERNAKINTNLNTKVTTTPLLESHFIRIQNKNLISSKTKELRKVIQTTKSSNVLLYQQTIEATQRLLRKHTGSLDSYSIRKQKAKQKQTPLVFSPITNHETIFHDNKSFSKINENNDLSQVTGTAVPSFTLSKSKPESRSLEEQGLITRTNEENQKNQDLENNVTFRIFPGLFNHFKHSSKVKDKDPFFQKKENQNNVKEKEQDEKQLGTLLDISDKNNKQDFEILKQQNLFSNTEINNKKKAFTISNLKHTPLTEKSKQKGRAFKHELLVSSSSYPVEKVNFLIERDDELAGYRHRIILEVWTNGSISPRQAIFESIGSIIKLIYNFREPLRNSFNYPSIKLEG